MHSSNTLADCDMMFVPEFMKVDEIIRKSLEAKQEQTQNLLESLASVIQVQQ